MHPDVHCSTIYNSQNMEATLMSINRGMEKDLVHVSFLIYFLKLPSFFNLFIPPFSSPLPKPWGPQLLKNMSKAEAVK